MFTSVFALTLAAALQNAPAAEPAKPAEEKKICVIEQSSYSRLGRKRVCRTQREVKERQEQIERDSRVQ
ncbi:hypothetical protein MZO42_19260 [Sphingomonas psychrotolerans]|uniref:Secreted protein n=1 Tax=Sphingomonas psychrotolerans TaxID=1327635 RepID=A0ABU3N8K8_9SPHN|nr:hypothetical protein [Sphingomonas psychrotolerans]MDT8760844.1 hypothetical protein [Sphingomonas psychrotolerans]